MCAIAAFLTLLIGRNDDTGGTGLEESKTLGLLSGVIFLAWEVGEDFHGNSSR